jgi:glyoxylase-like metal-dependent hydrolase (beta-lactamase superfamily II)
MVLEADNPGPMTGSGNHTYLLVSDDGEAILVDAGVGEPRHLASLDRELRAHAAHLSHVLVTHAHIDHVAGAPSIAGRHPEAVFAKYPWPAEDDHVRLNWRPLADGDTILFGNEQVRVLHTPGHSPDHVAFWHEQTRTCLVGDLVIEGGSVTVPASRGGDMARYLASLERLLSLRPDSILPAHGPQIRNPAAALAGHLEHRAMRERQVVEALRKGYTSVPSIAENIYHGLDRRLMAAALDTVRAHLDKLVREGQAVEEKDGWRST